MYTHGEHKNHLRPAQDIIKKKPKTCADKPGIHKVRTFLTHSSSKRNKRPVTIRSSTQSTQQQKKAVLEAKRIEETRWSKGITSSKAAKWDEERAERLFHTRTTTRTPNDGMEAAGSASSLQPWKTLSFSETNKRKTKGKILMVLPQRMKKKSFPKEESSNQISNSQNSPKFL